jgi:hypothetical protein
VTLNSAGATDSRLLTCVFLLFAALGSTGKFLILF